jgi:hypothetical protein
VRRTARYCAIAHDTDIETASKAILLSVGRRAALLDFSSKSQLRVGVGSGYDS